MLQDLPIEVLEQIVGHLPTASSIVNLSRTNRALGTIISADDYNVFRTFVQRAFPTIKTPPIWKDVARTLTSRSRAWDRRAFIARECIQPPEDISYPQTGFGRHTIGYHPVIDSYETWQGSAWSSRKEVLAWGAGGRLRTRTIKDGVTTWSSYRSPEDHSQVRDILDVRILRPYQSDTSDTETLIFRRADREMVKVQTSEPNVFTEASRYSIPSGDLTCMDVNQSAEPILAACGDNIINLFPVHSSEKLIQPMYSVQLEDKYNVRQRMRCVKFLSETTVAISNQFLEGQDRAPIHVYDISPTGLSPTPLAESICYSEPSHPLWGRHSANIIVPLDNADARPGQLFLSGWSDGTARLYDTRIPRRPVAEYSDTVDSGQLLSLATIGHERFLAGSSQNGCLKTYDLRMPGANAYSYLDARRDTELRKPHRDMNMFLTPSVMFGERLWETLPRHVGMRSRDYRGSVYSLSIPSPSSSTIYAGIENHVLQVDFVSTDEVRNHRTDMHLGLHSEEARKAEQPILNMSCYERPSKGKETTEPVLLRNQVDFSTTLTNGIMGSEYGTREAGWDERSRLNTAVRGMSHRESGWRARRRQPT